MLEPEKKDRKLLAFKSKSNGPLGALRDGMEAWGVLAEPVFSTLHHPALLPPSPPLRRRQRKERDQLDEDPSERC